MSRTPPSDLTVTLRCNNACRFCPRTTLRHVELRDAGELVPRLEAIRAHSRRVTLSGGEVTILPGVVDLVSLCQRIGFSDVAIITNGRALATGPLAADLVDAGLTEACVTVYDLRPEVHDWFTRRPGSLAETLAGLDVLLGLARGGARLGVRVNTLLAARNADGLVPLVRAMLERGAAGVLVADVVLGDGYDVALPHERVRALAEAIAADPDIDARRVVFRGFPLCVLEGVEGVTAEPMDIDTTIVDERDLDSYFAEFFDNFVHVDECGRCAMRDRCPGIQRRHLHALGDGSIRAVTVPASVRRDVAQFERWPDPGRLAVTPTTACQMRCTYCQVELGRRNAPPEVLDRSVDLLLTSQRERVELQFFGGEPLLRRDEVVRTMERADALARSRGKRIRFTVTTNGILLDPDLVRVLERFDARVLFSVDGPPDVTRRFRPMRGRSPERVYRTIERNLTNLARSRVEHFVNIVATPDGVGDLPKRIGYLAGLGVRTVQLCYALGPEWDERARSAFCEALRRCASEARRTGVRLQNLGSHAEPVVLSNDLLVDVDGTLYGDAALFAEKAFPGLRDAYRIGSVFELSTFDGLRRSREANLAALRATYPDGTRERRTVEMHLEMGRAVQATLDDMARSTTQTADRNPLLDTLLSRSVAEQAAIMRRHPSVLKLPLLMLSNPCAWDCVFCRSKDLETTPLGEVTGWVAGNDDVGLERLGLAGNEPLAHPRIDDILVRAREHGFVSFEALTTGEPLADPDRARELVEAGVTSLSIPLFGSRPGVHDAVTRTPGSFARSLAALENVLSLGARVKLHTNLLRQNLDDVPDLVRLAGELGLPLCAIPVRPKDANLPYVELVPRYSDIVERRPLPPLVAFPACVAARVQDPPVPDASAISDVLKVYVLDQPFVKPPACVECALRRRCSGTFQAYLDLYGAGELSPPRR